MALEKYRQRPRAGSLEYYQQRCEELATENDELRVRLDAALERDHRRCAFLRGMQGG